MAALLLSGCGTTGKETVIRTVFEIHNNENCRIVISPGIDQASKMGDLSDISTDNRPDMPWNLTVPLSGGGALGDVIPILTPKDKPGKSPVLKPDPVKKKLEIASLKLEDDGKGPQLYSWWNHTGSYYGGPVIVTVEGCGTYTIPDATRKWMPDMKKSHHDQFTWFSGVKDQTTETGMQRDTFQGRASMFTRPGCTAETATLTYEAK